jgi:hypothetical protein
LTAGAPLFASGRRARNLVIVRAGNGSLHPGWLAGPEERNWDIIVNYYGDDPDLYRGENIVRIDSKGAKWPALYALYQEHREEILKYDYVWLPDDDLAADKKTINRMFDLCAEMKLDLAQPALSHDSYYSHLVTLKNSEFLLRYTNFIEIMAPVFSRAFLPPCADSFKENLSGFGLDLLWPTWLGGDQRAAIIDDCVIRHTRVLGGPNHAAVTATGKTPMKELAGVFAKFGLITAAHKIVGGIDRRGYRVSILGGQGAELILKVLSGYLPELAQEKYAIFSLLQPMLRDLASAPADAAAVPKHRAELQRRIHAALQMGVALLQSGNPAHAVKVLGLSLAEMETRELWNDWATAQYSRGDQVRAEWGYRSALRLDPSYRDSAVNLGLLLLQQGRTEESIAVLQPHIASLNEQEKREIVRLGLNLSTNDSVPATFPASSMALPTKMWDQVPTNGTSGCMS